MELSKIGAVICTILFSTSFSFPIIPNYVSQYQEPVVVTAFDYETEMAARIANAEARGEKRIGQLYVVQVVVNRAKKSGKKFSEQIKKGFCGYKVKRFNQFDTTFYYMVKDIVKSKKKIHDFRYFLNPDTATNKKMLQMMRQSKKKKRLGNHIFFNK